VSEADRLLIAVEDALAIATQERLEAAIDLYRAMGGAAQSGPGPVNQILATGR
jgi:outer membrane protein TolC